MASARSEALTVSTDKDSGAGMPEAAYELSATRISRAHAAESEPSAA